MNLICFFGVSKIAEVLTFGLNILSLWEHLGYFVSLHICCYSEHLVNIPVDLCVSSSRSFPRSGLFEKWHPYSSVRCCQCTVSCILVSVLLFIPIENICTIGQLGSQSSARFPPLIWNASEVGIFSSCLSHLCELPVCTPYPFPAKVFPQWCADVCVGSECWPTASFSSVTSIRSVFMGQLILFSFPVSFEWRLVLWQPLSLPSLASVLVDLSKHLVLAVMVKGLSAEPPAEPSHWLPFPAALQVCIQSASNPMWDIGMFQPQVASSRGWQSSMQAACLLSAVFRLSPVEVALLLTAA